VIIINTKAFEYIKILILDVFFVLIKKMNFLVCLFISSICWCNGENGTIRLKEGLLPNYTAKHGERIRFDCEFESNKPIDTIYWIRNLEEIIQPIEGKIRITRKNQSTTLIFRRLDSLDRGSYSCYAENIFGFNVTSETMLNIIVDNHLYQNKNKK
jgi:hypothetical protein